MKVYFEKEHLYDQVMKVDLYNVFEKQILIYNILLLRKNDNKLVKVMYVRKNFQKDISKRVNNQISEKEKVLVFMYDWQDDDHYVIKEIRFFDYKIIAEGYNN